MAEQMTERELSDMMRLKKLAAQMEESEYLGLSEEEIQEKKRQKEMRKQKNVQILEDTLEILEKGSYTAGAEEVCLHFTPGRIREVRVFLPDEIAALGAFGCGVYGNDAATVSDLFYRAIKNLSCAGIDSGRLFDSIDFAVLCRSDKDYNYVEFSRNFSKNK